MHSPRTRAARFVRATSSLNGEPVKTTLTLPSPLGNLILHLHQDKLTKIEYASSDGPSSHSLSHPLCQEFQKYFKNPRHVFNIPLHLEGTPFQKKVWQALCDIPFGTTLHYGELAKNLSTSARAIGNACRQNPIPILIPCHRIVAKNHLGGYAGKTTGKMLTIKQWLLQHECL